MDLGDSAAGEAGFNIRDDDPASATSDDIVVSEEESVGTVEASEAVQMGSPEEPQPPETAAAASGESRFLASEDGEEMTTDGVRKEDSINMKEIIEAVSDSVKDIREKLSSLKLGMAETRLKKEAHLQMSKDLLQDFSRLLEQNAEMQQQVNALERKLQREQALTSGISEMSRVELGEKVQEMYEEDASVVDPSVSEGTLLKSGSLRETGIEAQLKQEEVKLQEEHALACSSSDLQKIELCETALEAATETNCLAATAVMIQDAISSNINPSFVEETMQGKMPLQEELEETVLEGTVEMKQEENISDENSMSSLETIQSEPVLDESQLEVEEVKGQDEETSEIKTLAFPKASLEREVSEVAAANEAHLEVGKEERQEVKDSHSSPSLDKHALDGGADERQANGKERVIAAENSEDLQGMVLDSTLSDTLTVVPSEEEEEEEVSVESFQPSQQKVLDSRQSDQAAEGIPLEAEEVMSLKKDYPIESDSESQKSAMGTVQSETLAEQTQQGASTTKQHDDQVPAPKLLLESVPSPGATKRDTKKLSVSFTGAQILPLQEAGKKLDVQISVPTPSGSQDVALQSMLAEGATRANTKGSDVTIPSASVPGSLEMMPSRLPPNVDAAMLLCQKAKASLSSRSALDRTPSQAGAMGSIWMEGPPDDISSALRKASLGQALWEAAAEGQTKMVRRLVSHGADLNYKSIEQATPLHIAALRGHADAAWVLASAGAPLEVRDANGWTPLHNAARCGWDAVVRALLVAGADVEAKDACGTTALHYALRSEHTTVARTLLAATGMDEEKIEAHLPDVL